MNASDRTPYQDRETDGSRADEPGAAREAGDDSEFDDDVVTAVRVAPADRALVSEPEAIYPEAPAVSLKVRRHRRTRPRGTTIAMKRITMADLRLGAALYPPVDLARPQTRGDCGAETRPCPWVSCKHHLYLDINPETGSIKLNFPDREPWELEHSCALDIAESGGKTLDEIGEITNLTRERIRQVEAGGLLKLRTRRELR